MKKIYMFITLLFCLLMLSTSKKQLQNEVSLFIEKYNICYADIKPYLAFTNFKLNDFFMLESLRINKNYSYIETINYFYNHNIKPAIFTNSNLVLVNKFFYLEKDYIPPNLTEVPKTIKHANDNIMLLAIVLEAYIKMITELELHNLYIFSGYRDYYKQAALYKYYQDDNYSAKPGFSEHQTGLAIDISRKDIGLTNLFKDTFEYQILIENCYKYGFILRYPEGKQNYTGYYYEPWHFRYVGKIHAQYIMNNNLTLEEYLYANFEF